MSYWGKWPGCWVNVRVLNLESAGAKGSQGWRSKPETPKYMQRPLEQDEMDGLFTWTWCSKKFISAAKVTLLKCTRSLSGAPHVALVEGACFTASQCTEKEHGAPKVKVTAHIKISSKKLVWVPANIGLIPKVRPTRVHHLLSPPPHTHDRSPWMQKLCPWGSSSLTVSSLPFTLRGHTELERWCVFDMVASNLSSPSSLIALISDWLSSVDPGHRQIC